MSDHRRRRNFIDLTGKQCGDFLVLSEVTSWGARTRWRARHRCGGEVVLFGVDLRKRPPSSCVHCRVAKVKAKGAKFMQRVRAVGELSVTVLASSTCPGQVVKRTR